MPPSGAARDRPIKRSAGPHDDGLEAGLAFRGSLDSFDCREPGRCAMVVVSRLNQIRFDGDYIPSIAGFERRSQLFLTDRLPPGLGTIVTETQHIHSSIVLGHRR